MIGSRTLPRTRTSCDVDCSLISSALCLCYGAGREGLWPYMAPWAGRVKILVVTRVLLLLHLEPLSMLICSTNTTAPAGRSDPMIEKIRFIKPKFKFQELIIIRGNETRNSLSRRKSEHGRPKITTDHTDQTIRRRGSKFVFVQEKSRTYHEKNYRLVIQITVSGTHISGNEA